MDTNSCQLSHIMCKTLGLDVQGSLSRPCSGLRGVMKIFSNLDDSISSLDDSNLYSFFSSLMKQSKSDSIPLVFLPFKQPSVTLFYVVLSQEEFLYLQQPDSPGHSVCSSVRCTLSHSYPDQAAAALLPYAQQPRVTPLWKRLVLHRY